MPFLVFLKSFEVLLYEVMSWLVFYPRTLWRSGRHPLRMMERSEHELTLPAPEQFKDVVSPPIFLLLTVVAAHAFEVAVVGNSALIDNGIGLAGMIQDNTSLILFRLVVFSSMPIISGALENSHVDIAEELTDMIAAQRSYTANSKVFQTGSDLMDVLVNLKR